MYVCEMRSRISPDHLLERTAADQLKTTAGISSRDKIAFLSAFRRGTESSDIGQRSLLHTFPTLDATLRNEIPIDRLEWVKRPGKVFVEPQQAFDLLRFEADIGIDKQQMGSGRIV